MKDNTKTNTATTDGGYMVPADLALKLCDLVRGVVGEGRGIYCELIEDADPDADRAVERAIANSLALEIDRAARANRTRHPQTIR